jgi:hypothetical protein
MFRSVVNGPAPASGFDVHDEAPYVGGSVRNRRAGGAVAGAWAVAVAPLSPVVSAAPASSRAVSTGAVDGAAPPSPGIVAAVP